MFGNTRIQHKFALKILPIKRFLSILFSHQKKIKKNELINQRMDRKKNHYKKTISYANHEK